MLTPPSFTTHLLAAAEQGDEVAGKEHGEPLSQSHTRPSIFEGRGSGRCHPSRRDGIKDVLPRQLIIRYLHTRARNLYPSRPPLPRLLALPSKCIFRKSQADGEHYNSLAKVCEGCGCAQLKLCTGKGLGPHARVQGRCSKHKGSSSVIAQS